jgi:hypothetical protein
MGTQNVIVFLKPDFFRSQAFPVDGSEALTPETFDKSVDPATLRSIVEAIPTLPEPPLIVRGFRIDPPPPPSTRRIRFRDGISYEIYMGDCDLNVDRLPPEILLPLLERLHAYNPHVVMFFPATGLVYDLEAIRRSIEEARRGGQSP